VFYNAPPAGNIAFSTVKNKSRDKDLPSCDELALQFRSTKYAPYFHQALELDHYKGAGISKPAELSSKVMRPSGDSQG
jgi:hypothetical protein